MVLGLWGLEHFSGGVLGTPPASKLPAISFGWGMFYWVLGRRVVPGWIVRVRA